MQPKVTLFVINLWRVPFVLAPKQALSLFARQSVDATHASYCTLCVPSKCKAISTDIDLPMQSRKQYLGLYQHFLWTPMSQAINKQQVNQKQNTNTCVTFGCETILLCFTPFLQSSTSTKGRVSHLPAF